MPVELQTTENDMLSANQALNIKLDLHRGVPIWKIMETYDVSLAMIEGITRYGRWAHLQAPAWSTPTITEVEDPQTREEMLQQYPAPVVVDRRV
jgi:hypothetical protein